MTTAIHQLRVNVKSLAAEARFIRQEVRRARQRETKEQLCLHRMGRLKPEARLAHLALAFCRDVPYRRVEPNANTPPNRGELTKKISRFVRGVNEATVKNWLET